MQVAHLHEWTLTRQEAQRVQIELRSRLQVSDEIGIVRTIAGIDASVRGDKVTAAVVLLSYPDLDLQDASVAQRPLTFPYIPGLLSFREAPAILAAAEALAAEPDLVVVDGHAIAHPRRFGLGAHIGLLLDKPTFGCAKSLLVGHHDPVGGEPGAFQYLLDCGETIGAAVRTKPRTNPVYISVGHKITLATAMEYLLSTCRGFRLPEPIRQAHLAAGRGNRHVLL